MNWKMEINYITGEVAIVMFVARAHIKTLEDAQSLVLFWEAGGQNFRMDLHKNKVDQVFKAPGK